jgi:hypothetical protein
LEKWIEYDLPTDEEKVIKNISAIAYAGESLCVTNAKAALIFKFLAGADTVSNICTPD